jgi:hypothetical protein
MQNNLLQSFLNKTDKYDLPDKWVSDPLPPPAKKRCGSRPRKLSLPDARKSCDAARDSIISDDRSYSSDAKDTVHER